MKTSHRGIRSLRGCLNLEDSTDFLCYFQSRHRPVLGRGADLQAGSLRAGNSSCTVSRDSLGPNSHFVTPMAGLHTTSKQSWLSPGNSGAHPFVLLTRTPPFKARLWAAYITDKVFGASLGARSTDSFLSVFQMTCLET